ncbi:MAG: cytidylate kinase-like family protein [Oscillospiraceae bacterium]|nr:cytidylate kinase-like family protein [Oscillospiraceae bacterium]MBR5705725.1 cytidylate kinase-like family protein [Deltaproteobacteria bacterium]
MNILTISREFGSGGRELGKRMADLLGWDYYDREIIDAVAAEKGMDANYVNAVLERHEWWAVPITFRRSFTVSTAPNTDLLVKEKEVIERIGKSGRSCILVGRNADFFLRDYEPFRLFVCAEMEAKIRRCRERAEDGSALSDKEIERQIRRIDRSRSATRELVAGNRWGERNSYHLTVNTTDWEIRDLAPAVADFTQKFFERNSCAK